MANDILIALQGLSKTVGSFGDMRDADVKMAQIGLASKKTDFEIAKGLKGERRAEDRFQMDKELQPLRKRSAEMKVESEEIDLTNKKFIEDKLSSDFEVMNFMERLDTGLNSDSEMTRLEGTGAIKVDTPSGGLKFDDEQKAWMVKKMKDVASLLPGDVRFEGGQYYRYEGGKKTRIKNREWYHSDHQRNLNLFMGAVVDPEKMLKSMVARGGEQGAEATRILEEKDTNPEKYYNFVLDQKTEIIRTMGLLGMSEKALALANKGLEHTREQRNYYRMTPEAREAYNTNKKIRELTLEKAERDKRLQPSDEQVFATRRQEALGKGLDIDKKQVDLGKSKQEPSYADKQKIIGFRDKIKSRQKLIDSYRDKISKGGLVTDFETNRAGLFAREISGFQEEIDKIATKGAFSRSGSGIGVDTRGRRGTSFDVPDERMIGGGEFLSENQTNRQENEGVIGTTQGRRLPGEKPSEEEIRNATEVFGPTSKEAPIRTSADAQKEVIALIEANPASPMTTKVVQAYADQYGDDNLGYEAIRRTYQQKIMEGNPKARGKLIEEYFKEYAKENWIDPLTTPVNLNDYMKVEKVVKAYSESFSKLHNPAKDLAAVGKVVQKIWKASKVEMTLGQALKSLKSYWDILDAVGDAMIVGVQKGISPVTSLAEKRIKAGE